MGAVNDWRAGGRGEGIVEMGKISFQTFSNLFLKILTEGAVTTESGNLFQHFTTPTEKADSLL